MRTATVALPPTVCSMHPKTCSTWLRTFDFCRLRYLCSFINGWPFRPFSQIIGVLCFAFTHPPSRHIPHQNMPVPTRESVRAAPSLLSTLRGILFRVRPETSPMHTITKPTKKQKIRSATSDFYRISEVGNSIMFCQLIC